MILLIEDDADTLDAMCALLEDAGHEVVSVESAPLGLARLDGEFRPRLIVCDVHTPGMSAWELLQHPAMDGIPVLVISADRRDGERAAKTGVPFLEKPFGAEPFLARIAELIGR